MLDISLDGYGCINNISDRMKRLYTYGLEPVLRNITLAELISKRSKRRYTLLGIDTDMIGPFGYNTDISRYANREHPARSKKSFTSSPTNRFTTICRY